MRFRVPILFALASLAVVLVPASPSAADECPDFQYMPTICGTLYPQQPPTTPPPIQNAQEPARSVPGPTQQPGETCFGFEFRDGINTTGPTGGTRLYTFVINLGYCLSNRIVTQATVTSSTPRGSDPRLRELFGRGTAFEDGVGTNDYLNRQEVFFRVCGDPGNLASCATFRHVFDVNVLGRNNAVSSGGRVFSGDFGIPT
jgi:hypothetical protein